MRGKWNFLHHPQQYRLWGYQRNFHFYGFVGPLECIFMALLALFNEGVPAHFFHLKEAPMMSRPERKYINLLAL